MKARRSARFQAFAEFSSTAFSIVLRTDPVVMGEQKRFGSRLRVAGPSAPSLVHCTPTLGRYRYNVNLCLDTVPMKAIQLRMARAAIGWGVRELAKKAGVTANTVTRIENGADAKQSTMDRLQNALEEAGI